jgi:hypothetical protein
MVSWSGSNGKSESMTLHVVGGGVFFPPRRDRRRHSLAYVHRHIVDRLRGLAILELVATGLIEQFRPKLK